MEDDQVLRVSDQSRSVPSRFGADNGFFQTVQGLKDGTIKAKDIAVEELFSNYLTTIERVIDAVDAYIQKGD